MTEPERMKAMREEDASAPARERRAGASRLSHWSSRSIALLWLAWPATLLVLVGLSAIASDYIHHGMQEFQLATTRPALIMFALALVVPPACLTLLWWRMRDRRRVNDLTT